jgi:hypothetical protein
MARSGQRLAQVRPHNSDRTVDLDPHSMCPKNKFETLGGDDAKNGADGAMYSGICRAW